jgi:preprotein translocase subunit SecE
MANFKEYIQDTYNEMLNKVSWPTWSELQNSAILVMVASVIIALIVYAMDKGFSEILRLYYQTF